MKRKSFLKALFGLPLALKTADTLTDGDVKMKEFRESGFKDRKMLLKDFKPDMLAPARGAYDGYDTFDLSSTAMTCVPDYPEDIV